jgi:hypothetical protein
MTLNATREREHYLRMAEVFDNEAVIARYRFNDEEMAKIYDSGADRYREQAERFARLINGSK